MNFQNYIEKCKPELIGEIIVKSNMLESHMNRLITQYLEINNSVKKDFVNNVILNPLNMLFSKKYQIFKLILIEKLDYSNKDLRELDSDFHKLFNIRNIVAHNEPSPDLKYRKVVTEGGAHNYYEFDFNNVRMLHIDKNVKPGTANFSYPKIEELCDDFNIKWKKLSKLLNDLDDKL